MNENHERLWRLRLTIMNKHTGQSSMTVYPQDKYTTLEDLDYCQLPYGSGDYRHLLSEDVDRYSDSLHVALTGVIENEEHPPSIQELNHLGLQIQKLTAEGRAQLEKQLMEMPDATITNALNAIYTLLSENKFYDGISLANRSVLLEKDEPLLRVQMVVDDDESHDSLEEGYWLDCPSKKGDLEKAAFELGVNIDELCTNAIDGVLACSVLDLFDPSMNYCDLDEYDELTCAMQEKNIIQQLGKFKAVLAMEGCTDVPEATELARKLDEYEFCLLTDLHTRYECPDYKVDYSIVADNLDLEQTNYGFVRNSNIPRVITELDYRMDVDIEKNKERIYTDLPNCVHQLLALESEVGGKSGTFAEWLRIVYELNDDFDESPAAATKKLCSAFQDVKKSYGTIIANTLYNAQSIVLTSELMPAAMYLHCGGDMETANTLADSGFFTESYDYDCMKQAAQFMADGGAVNDVYRFISEHKKEDSSEMDASEMTMAQRL